jgi:hypothetical protein
MAENQKDLVATGILPVIPNRQAGSLSHQSVSGAHRVAHENKPFDYYHIAFFLSASSAHSAVNLFPRFAPVL